MNITLTWKQENKYTMKAGDYRVSKTFDAETALYTAWARINWVWEPLSVKLTADQAKAECELHYMENIK